MIFKANQVLQRATENENTKPSSFKVSKDVLEAFRKQCQEDDAKYSKVLVEIIKDFILYVDSGKPLNIPTIENEDLINASFSCPFKTWRSFSHSLKDLPKKQTILEYLMKEYCKQRAKASRSKR